MPLIDFDLDAIPEPQVLPQGSHQLRIANAEKRTQDGTKGNSDFIVLNMQSVAEASAKSVSHVLFMPDPTIDEGKNIGRMKQLKRFVKAFNAPYPFDSDDLSGFIGLEGFCTLEVESDPTYGEQNRVRAFEEAR